MTDARENLKMVVRTAGVFLSEYYGLDAFKAVRDKREPGRRRKMAMEARLEAAVMRMFRRQAKKVREFFQASFPERKAVLDVPPVWSPGLLGDPEYEAIIRLILMEAARDGIGLFAEQVLIGMDYTVTNQEAAEWARTYTDEFLRSVNSTTSEQVGRWISDFVETPGMTIGDVVRALPFSERRAQTIAVTEITRAYAEGNQLAGRDLKRQFPDVRVAKRWFTNNDSLVCVICGPLNDNEVALEEKFVSSGGWTGDNPPAHPNCRCWTSTYTTLGEIGEEGEGRVDTSVRVNIYPEDRLWKTERNPTQEELNNFMASVKSLPDAIHKLRSANDEVWLSVERGRAETRVNRILLDAKYLNNPDSMIAKHEFIHTIISNNSLIDATIAEQYQPPRLFKHAEVHAPDYWGAHGEQFVMNITAYDRDRAVWIDKVRQIESYRRVQTIQEAAAQVEAVENYLKGLGLW